MEPISQSLLVAALVGLALWLIKKFLQDYFTTKIDLTYDKLMETQKKLAEHLEKCDEIPKSLIIEKIDNLTNSLGEIKKDVRDLKNDFKEQNRMTDLKFQDISFAVRSIKRLDIT